MAEIDTFNNLRQAILTKIESDETTIQEAHFEERFTFDGSPAAVIGVSPNEGLYHSQKADRMTFVFRIRIYIPLVENETAFDHTHDIEERMGKAYWEVLRMFNQRGVLDGQGLAVEFVEPIPSFWDFEERGQGVYRFSEINLRCVCFVSNSTPA